MAVKPKKITVVTAESVARFPYLHAPDTEGTYADNKYKITQVFAGDTDFSTVEAAAYAHADRVFPNVEKSKLNILIHTGDDATKGDGTPIEELKGKFTITSKSLYAPQLVSNTKGVLPDGTTGWLPLPAGVEIRGGDTVRCILSPIDSPKPLKFTITFRLNAVQLIAKRASTGHDYSGGFGGDGDTNTFGGTDSTPSTGVEAGDAIDDDDLPF